MAAVGIWDRLTADEFKQLQEHTRYSKRRLKDVLLEFREGLHQKYDPEQPMGYAGFKVFMSSYLGEDISDELCQTLFYTFHKKVPITDVISPKLPNPLLKKFLNETGKVASMESLDGDLSSMSRIARGARRATVVATATVVAGISSEAAGSLMKNDLSPDLSPDGSLLSTGKVDMYTPPYHSHTPSNEKPGNGHPCKSPSKLARVPDGDESQGTGMTKSLSFDDSSHNNVNANNHTPKLQFLPMIEIKEIACYLSLLEGGDVQDKLEFVFRVYDSDDNNYLDQQELESIVQQMIRVAEYLGWDTAALKPILNDMLAEMDCDADGQISMEEWIKGGMNNIPFLVLLGMDVKVDEEGKHQWQMHHFNKQTFCNLCHGGLTGFGKKQGFQCIFCRWTVHERCVARVPNSCIQTFTTSKSQKQRMSMDHHWVEGNCPGKCNKCNKTIKSNCLTGLHCAWCQMKIHNRCVPNTSYDCSLGRHRVHILPPICIMPQTVKKKGSIQEGNKKNSVISYDGIPMQITPLAGTNPLIVFVNPKSGGRQGARLLNKFRFLLNPRQVFNLADGGPMPGLKFFSQIPDFRVLCCGGDGTAGWVLSMIDRLPTLKQRPPMAIIPLGTGNDLSRCLNWGGGYDGSSLEKYLIKVANSTNTMLDRWEIELEETERCEDTDTIPLTIMNNYFSVGVDASIALKFHLQREKNPEKFNSRLNNKLRYFAAGTSEQLAASCKKLQDEMEIYCDGVKLDISSGPSLEGIAILNIPSIYGGANIWGEGEKRKRRQPKDPQDLNSVNISMGDGKVEVVGLENSLYVGQIIAGVRQHGIRLAQCSTVELRVRRTVPMQVDGEPWMQAPAVVKITHKNRTPMCMAPSSNKRGIRNFFRGRSGSA